MIPRGSDILKTQDHFEIALAFLIVTVVMALVMFLWFPQDFIYVGFVGSNAVSLNRNWLVRILLLPPFSLFLGFVIVGASKALKKYLFESR